MALHVFDDSTQGAFFILLIILTPISVAATCLRFIATRYAKRKTSVEDWFALAALMVYLAWTILTFFALAASNGRDLAVMALKKPDDYAYMRKFSFVEIPLFPLQMFFSKLSILVLYRHIFGVNRTYTRWIYGILAVHLMWTIAVIVSQLLQCLPLKKFWYPSTPGHCISESVAFIAVESVNSGVDFAMVILANFMIRSLQLSSRVKWKLRFLFGLGSMVGIIGYIKIGLQYSPDGIYSFVIIGLWNTVQMAAAIICCCAPAYGPILPDEGFWSRLGSKIRITGLKSPCSSFTNRKGGRIHMNKPGGESQGWAYLADSTSRLAGTQYYHAEIHAMVKMPVAPSATSLDAQRDAIRVQRSVDVV